MKTGQKKIIAILLIACLLNPLGIFVDKAYAGTENEAGNVNGSVSMDPVNNSADTDTGEIERSKAQAETDSQDANDQDTSGQNTNPQDSSGQDSDEAGESEAVKEYAGKILLSEKNSLYLREKAES